MKTKFCKGEILYYEGDVLDQFCFLVSGSVKAFKYQGEHEMFLYSLCGGLISDVGGVALSSVEFLEDSEVSFSEVLSDAALFTESQKRTLLLNDALNIMCFSAMQRVAWFLLNKDFNAYKKVQIAHMLNITGETLSRVLKKLYKLNVIGNTPDTNILDEKCLRSMLQS